MPPRLDEALHLLLLAPDRYHLRRSRVRAGTRGRLAGGPHRKLRRQRSVSQHRLDTARRRQDPAVCSDGTRLGHSARPPRYLAVGPVLSGESAFYLPDKIEIGDRPLGDSASSALDGDSRPLRSIQHCVAVRGHWRRPPQPTDRRLQSNRSCHPPGRSDLSLQFSAAASRTRRVARAGNRATSCHCRRRRWPR
jgi:hypothetical protein